MNCPACGCQTTGVFFEAERAVVFCNVLWDSREQALAAPRGKIALALCDKCGFIHNAAFEAKLAQYAPAYENSLHFSPRFQRYADGLCASLVERHRLYDKDIVEIGCGKGEFLSMLCRKGANRGLGFDPSYDPAVRPDTIDESITIVPESFFAANFAAEARRPGDFICCRHVLEHISRPLEFLVEIRRTIGNRNRTVVFFEVPNTLYTLKDLGVWDIIYEHCNYFTPASLGRIFARAGFETIEVNGTYGGQFITIEATPRPGGAARPSQDALPDEELARLVRDFGSAHHAKLEYWRGVLDELQCRRAKAVVWGAGSKGVTFLNATGDCDGVISHVVDLNPRKHDRYTPGSARKVVPPQFLRGYRPDAIVVMNPIYLQEIRKLTGEMAVRAGLLVA